MKKNKWYRFYKYYFDLLDGNDSESKIMYGNRYADIYYYYIEIYKERESELIDNMKNDVV